MRKQEVPGPDGNAVEMLEFVKRFDPTADFRHLWGAGFAEHAETLDDVLTAQLETGKPQPEAPLEDLLLCFCRMWAMAPYLGIDTVEAFLRHPRARWLLAGIREKAA